MPSSNTFVDVNFKFKFVPKGKLVWLADEQYSAISSFFPAFVLTAGHVF